MPRKPRVVESPLERIARQLCAIERPPYAYSSQETISLQGLPDAKAFAEAVRELRVERCDKSLLDEALVLERQSYEIRERLSELRKQLPPEAIVYEPPALPEEETSK